MDLVLQHRHTMKGHLMIILILGILLPSACSSYQPVIESSGTPKNIILLIGDGMGINQITTRYYFNKENETSNFSRFRYIGLHINIPKGERVTDSAAGATAFSAGVQTYNGAIGVDSDTVPVKTILEIVAEDGWKTGVIATSSIVHATPASFYAHTALRTSYEEIARQLVYSPVDFFAGGGLQFFVERADRLNYLDSLQQYGFEVRTDKLSLSNPSSDQKYGFLLAPDGMPKMQQGRGNFLPKATKLAIKHLSQEEKPFFLMAEGSQIDWGGHGNDALYIIEEMKDFDETIGEALDFARKDGNTLVVVTADHEAGGFSLPAATVFGRPDYRKLTPAFTTGNHTAALVPVFAYGPGAELFTGIYYNYEIFDKMMQALGKEK